MNKKLQAKLLNIAYDLRHICNGRAKHTTFLLRKHKIVSIGHNHYWRTDPMAKRFGHKFDGIHSELAAIKNYRGHIYDLPELTLYNVRINAVGDACMSKPCIACQAMLSFFEIRRIYYTNAGAAWEKFVVR